MACKRVTWGLDSPQKKKKKSLKQVGLGLNNNRSSCDLLNDWSFPYRIPDFTSSKHWWAQVQCLSQLSLWRAEWWNDCGPFSQATCGVMGHRPLVSQWGRSSADSDWVGGCVSFLQDVIPGWCSHPASHPKLLQERRNFLFLQKWNKKHICLKKKKNNPPSSGYGPKKNKPKMCKKKKNQQKQTQPKNWTKIF